MPTLAEILRGMPSGGDAPSASASAPDVLGSRFYAPSGGDAPGPAMSAQVSESPVIAALRAKLSPDQMQQLQYGNIGPGGRDPASGLAYSWLPYDPAQQLFDSHQHFGPTTEDPTYGKLQSMYTEPSKSAHQLDKVMPLVFGAALSAITAGAGSAFLGPLMKMAMSYGTSGGIDPLSTALSFVPGAAGMVDPGLLPWVQGASGIYSASKGNPIPGAITLGKILSGG